MKFPKIPKFKLPKILPDGKFAKFMHIVGRLCQKLLCVLEWIGDRIRGIFGALMKWLKTLIVRVFGLLGKKTPKGVFYVGGADILPPPHTPRKNGVNHNGVQKNFRANTRPSPCICPLFPPKRILRNKRVARKTPALLWAFLHRESLQ